MVVVLAVGTAEQNGGHACDRADLLAARSQVVFDLLAAELGKMRMMRGMAHDLMPRLGQGSDGIRIAIDPVADDKEGRLHLIAIQNIEAASKEMAATWSSRCTL